MDPSYAVDYDDTFRDPRAAGHLGSVRIYSQPCAAPAVYSGPGYPANPSYISVPPVTVTPVDCVFGSNCPPPATTFDLGIGKIGEYNPNNPNGPYNFTLGVRNLGPAITSPQTITVTDVVPAGMTFTNVTSSNWTCIPLPGPPIPAGSTLTCTYSGSFPIAANQALGWVTIVATGTTGPYLNCANLGQPDSDPSNNQACIPVQKPQVGELLVEKVVVSHLMGNVIPSANYNVNVTCGGTTTTLNLPSNGTPQTVSNIPYGTQCTVVEPPPPVPPNLCPLGTTGAWTISYAPSSIPPINSVTTTVTVTNTFDCNPDGGNGSLIVKKEIINHTNPHINTTGMVFAISTSCQSGSSPAVVTPMPLQDNGTQTVSGLALNTVCTITEGTIGALPPGPVLCLTQGEVLTWTTVLPAPVTITGPGMTATVQNILDCKPPGGGQVGSLTVTKTVVNHTQGQLSTTGLSYP